MDFIGKWSDRTDLPAKQFVAWLGLTESKYFKFRNVLLPLFGARRLQPPLPSGMGVHGELRESMTGAEVERVMERAREAFPGVKPRVPSDNEPQFISRDFKEYIWVTGMSHVRTSPPH